MNPDEILIKEIVKMLENDSSRLKDLIDEIMKAKDNPRLLDKKKLGEAYFALQKIQMELYKLV